jgi:hypothetical protein
MPDTILDGSGEQVPGRRPLDGTDLEIAYNLLGDDLVVRVNKAGVQVFGVVLEKAAKPLTAAQLLEFKTENSDLVVTIATRSDTVRDVGYRLGRVASKLIKAAREKVNKT